MLRRISTLTILSLLIVAFFAMTVAATSEFVPNKRVTNPMVNKVMQYSLPYPAEPTNVVGFSSGKDVAQRSLGYVNPPGSQSPGSRLGYTFYDYQHNGTMGRQVTWGNSATEGPIIHFDWMHLPTSAIALDRAYMYNAYINTINTYSGTKLVQGAGEYAGYVGIDVTKTAESGNGGSDPGPNKAVLQGHNNEGSGYAPQCYWDFAPAFLFFGANSRVPDATQLWNAQTGAEYSIWPKMRYQDIAGSTPVTHLFAQTSMPDAADPQAIYYFRKIGANETGTWIHPPMIVDTIFDISQDVACSDVTGKVALVWTANLCPDLQACDYCSDNTGNVAEGSVQLDNDIYYMLSPDMGVTWLPRVNLTKNVTGEAGHRPYTDLSALMTTAENLAIGWSGRVWPEDPDGDGVGYDCSMFAWTEALGFHNNHADGLPRGNIRRVANLEWDQEVCNGGSWQMNGAKMSISECDGNLYFMWVQFNDIPNGVTDDCATRGIDGSDVQGSANGELFLSVSSTLDGLLWDAPRNLTNSYTPGCDSAVGTGGRCDSDHWPSMARYGSNLFTNVHDSIKVLDAGYGGDYYLPVEYICDQDAGGIVQDEGSWQEADVVWFQLACVDPVPTKFLNLSPGSIEFPSWSEPGTTECLTLTAENSGNANMSANYSINVTSGHTGAITLNGGTSGTINVDCGWDNTLDMTLCLGNGVVTVHAELTGNITFTGDFVGAPLVFPISFWFVDDMIPPEWNTLYADDNAKAPYLALTLGNNGNMGHQGEGKVNLDYFDYGDCDVYDEENEDDPYPGDASIYLYDGSKIICWDGPDSVMCNYSMFDHTWLTGGFFPSNHDPITTAPAWVTGSCNANVLGYEYWTRDTNILIQEYTFAPTDVDDPQFMVQAAKFTNIGTTPITGLAIGEGMDWDIPADSGSWNSSNFDATRYLMYQQGYDDNGASDECQRNDERYGGIAIKLVEANGTEQPFWGVYTMDNSTQVYPNGAFFEDSLWYYMAENTGYTVSDTTEGDLHMIATYAWDHTLGVGDDLLVVTVLVTGNLGLADFNDAVDEGLAWAECLFVSTGCCNIRGDIDHNGAGPDIGDLVYLVNYMFNAGPPPPCDEGGFYIEADVDGNGSGPDIGDLVYLVNYMFNAGPAPVPCP